MISNAPIQKSDTAIVLAGFSSAFDELLLPIEKLPPLMETNLIFCSEPGIEISSEIILDVCAPANESNEAADKRSRVTIFFKADDLMQF